MITMENVRQTLDAYFTQSQQDLSRTAANMNGFSVADWHKFHRYMRQYSSSAWAASQEVSLHHNLMRSVINEIK